MSQANIDALGPVYGEWGKGNFVPRFDVYADEMEWGWSDEFPGMEGVSPDHELASSRLRDWLSPWEEWRCEVEEYLTNGDFVVALTRYTGRGKGSGAAVDSLGAHVWKLRDGQVVRLEIFSSRDRALAVAGLGG